ncbi:MAG: hypothetical protein AAF549_06250, partial [Pseudomonadota bacterium]
HPYQGCALPLSYRGRILFAEDIIIFLACHASIPYIFDAMQNKEQQKKDARAAALRDNLKKRKAFQKSQIETDQERNNEPSKQNSQSE